MLTEFSHREIATILHALRTLQPDGCTDCCDHFEDDGVTPLTAEEIDDLCEKINCSTRCGVE